MKMKPMGNLVLLKVSDRQEKTKSGIILQNSTDRFVTAEVVSVGPGTRAADGTLIPVCLTPGDTVMMYADSGTEVTLEDEKYTLIRESEISLYSTND